MKLSLKEVVDLEGYDCSDLTWNDMYEEYESLDEGLRSAVKRLLGGKKKEEPAKPMSRGDELRKKYNVGPESLILLLKLKFLRRPVQKQRVIKKNLVVHVILKVLQIDQKQHMNVN